MRAGFRTLIESAAGLEVVGEASDGEEAVRLVRDQRPDVVLMDVRMPRVDGIEATKRIHDLPEAEKVRVLVLTTFDLDEYVHTALRAGASGFLLKGRISGGALERDQGDPRGGCAAGSVHNQATHRGLRPARRPEKTPASVLRALTERELEVLTLVARGLSNAEIAEELVVSPATAKTHVSRILTKLAARDRAQLVVVAYETGLVSPGD